MAKLTDQIGEPSVAGQGAVSAPPSGMGDFLGNLSQVGQRFLAQRSQQREDDAKNAAAQAYVDLVSHPPRDTGAKPM